MAVGGIGVGGAGQQGHEVGVVAQDRHAGGVGQASAWRALVVEVGEQHGERAPQREDLGGHRRAGPAGVDLGGDEPGGRPDVAPVVLDAPHAAEVEHGDPVRPREQVRRVEVGVQQPVRVQRRDRGHRAQDGVERRGGRARAVLGEGLAVHVVEHEQAHRAVAALGPHLVPRAHQAGDVEPEQHRGLAHRQRARGRTLGALEAPEHDEGAVPDPRAGERPAPRPAGQRRPHPVAVRRAGEVGADREVGADVEPRAAPRADAALGPRAPGTSPAHRSVAARAEPRLLRDRGTGGPRVGSVHLVSCFRMACGWRAGGAWVVTKVTPPPRHGVTAPPHFTGGRWPAGRTARAATAGSPNSLCLTTRTASWREVVATEPSRARTQFRKTPPNPRVRRHSSTGGDTQRRGGRSAIGFAHA